MTVNTKNHDANARNGTNKGRTVIALLTKRTTIVWPKFFIALLLAPIIAGLLMAPLGAAMLAHYGSVPLLFVYGQIAVGSAFFGILIFIYGMIFAPLWGLTFGLIYRALTIGENT